MIYEFQATQDLHGYGKPWAPGAGENILPPMVDGQYSGNGITGEVKNGILTMSGTSIGTENAFTIQLESPFIVTSEMVEAGYYYHLNNTIVSSSMVPVLETAAHVELTSASMNVRNRIVALTENMIGKSASQIRCYLGGADIATNGVYAPAFIKSSEITPYTPYANVCMPEGFNIWDPTNAEYVQVYAGYVNANTRELYLRPVYQEYDGEELVGPWMSSLDEYSEDATPTEGAFVIDFGGELESVEITPFMLQTLLDSLGIRQHFTNGAGLLNSLMDQAQGRVRSEEELLNRSLPLHVIAIGDQLPTGITFKPISKDVLPGLPGKFIR